MINLPDSIADGFWLASLSLLNAVQLTKQWKQHLQRTANVMRRRQRRIYYTQWQYQA